VSGGIAAADGYHGYVSQPTLMLVGERGRERVDVTPGGTTAGGGGNWYISIDVHGGMGKEEAAELVKDAIRDNTRQVRSEMIAVAQGKGRR
jgi:hypothetical protein